MSLQVNATNPVVPPTPSAGLKPLDRRPAAAQSAPSAGDNFCPQGTQGRKPLVLGNAARTLPTLNEAFDHLRTEGGGPAQARLLPRNTDAWNARWDMLQNAKTTIDASYFSLEKDVYGYAFMGALLKKQMEGVHVRVMTDAAADSLGVRGFTTPFRGRDYLQELVNHGAKAYAYNPFWDRPGLLKRGDAAILASDHDKILVVDGKRGITGGRNIGIDYLTETADRKGAWRDMDVEFKGAGAAKGLAAGFDAEMGDRGAAKPIGKDFINWDKKDIQLLGAYELMNIWLNDPAMSEAEKKAVRANPAAQKSLADDLLNRAVAKLATDMPQASRRQPSKDDMAKLRELAAEMTQQLEARGSRQKYLTQSLPEHAAEVKIIDKTSVAAQNAKDGIGPNLLKLVDSARKHIVIENPYVVLTENMMLSLEKASARGVKIDIITNSPLSTDSDVTQAFFLEDWMKVLARCENARIFVATGDRKFHTKSAVIDGEQAFVSTYNLDYLSGRVNSEIGAVVKSPELASDLLHEFDKDRAEKSNGFLEYTIKKDANGHAILKDGQPQRQFGPEDHLPADVQAVYAKKRHFWGETMRNHLPYFASLRHPPLRR